MNGKRAKQLRGFAKRDYDLDAEEYEVYQHRTKGTEQRVWPKESYKSFYSFLKRSYYLAKSDGSFIS